MQCRGFQPPPRVSVSSPAHSGNSLALSTVHCVEKPWEVTLPSVPDERTANREDKTPAPQEKDPGGTVFVNSVGETHKEVRPKLLGSSQ